MVKVTNISTGQIVCDLKGGNTLRLDKRKSTTIREDEITSHIENLIKKGHLLSENVPEVKAATPQQKKANKPQSSVVENEKED